MGWKMKLGKPSPITGNIQSGNNTSANNNGVPVHGFKMIEGGKDNIINYHTKYILPKSKADHAETKADQVYMQQIRSNL